MLLLLGARSAPLPDNPARCDPTVPLWPQEAAGAAFTELAWAAVFALPKLPAGSQRPLANSAREGEETMQRWGVPILQLTRASTQPLAAILSSIARRPHGPDAPRSAPGQLTVPLQGFLKPEARGAHAIPAAALA